MADDEGVKKIGTNLSEEKGAEREQGTNSKRPTCERCKRPKKVCLCVAIPKNPIEVSTAVYILQHPEERTRSLTTVPLLSACLPSDRFMVYNDVRYSQEKYPALHKLLKCPQTLVLYPDASAIDLREVVKQDSPGQKYNLVVPDGTWRQARSIFRKNDALQQARKVKLNENTKSHYVIRTQPTRNSLSTLEAVAVALSILEGREEITEELIRPLELLCDIQLQHGAVPHESKQEKKEQELLRQEKEKMMEQEKEKMEKQGKESIDEIETESEEQDKNIHRHDQSSVKKCHNQEQNGETLDHLRRMKDSMRQMNLRQKRLQNDQNLSN